MIRTRYLQPQARSGYYVVVVVLQGVFVVLVHDEIECLHDQVDRGLVLQRELNHEPLTICDVARSQGDRSVHERLASLPVA